MQGPLTVVVTGAASGIGEALARHAAGNGARVALADIDEIGLARVAAELPGLGAAEVVSEIVDVSRYRAVESFADLVFASFEGIDVVFNNAGIETTGLLWEIDPQRWDRSTAVNVSGVFYGVRAFVPRLVAAGRPARIVNLASVGALTTGPLMTPYIVSKHAVLALTECLAHEFQEFAPHLRASAVLPGPVSTAIFGEGARASESGESMRLEIGRMLADSGMSPARAAEIIFQGIEQDRLWIHTHPDLSAASIQHRADALMAGSTGPQ